MRLIGHSDFRIAARLGLVAVAVAAASAHGASASSAPASREAGASSVANKPTALAPRGETRPLDDVVISSRDGGTASWYRSLPVALGAVLAIIVGCAFVVKKYLPTGRRGGSGELLEVIARTYLSPKQSICLVRAGRRMVMVGVTADRMTPLADFENAEAVAQLVGQAEAHKIHSSTVAFRGLVQDEGTVYERGSGEKSVGGSEAEDGSYEQVHGHLHRLLSRIREYTEERRAG